MSVEEDAGSCFMKMRTHLRSLDDGYVLQEFIQSSEYAPNIYCNNGKSFAVVLKKTKLKQGIVGNALAVERVNEPDIAELAIRAAKAIGLTGPVDIDIRRRSDGTPVVLKLTPVSERIWQRTRSS